MAKNTYVSTVSGVPAGHTKDDGTYTNSTVTRYITQVDLGDGGKPYDIATHHKINFRNGSNDNTGTDWNGLEDITVVIPDVSDLIANPIDFVGTIGANGEISYKESGHVLKAGDLVFAAADCSFVTETGKDGIAIEAGDMAIYDGAKWIVVSGENQVSILAGGAAASDDNTTPIAISGAAKDVLRVEGKELALAIDYADVKSHVSATKQTLNVAFTENSNSVTVADAYVGLTKASDVPTTIGTAMSFANPTALANGTVTFASASGYYKNGDFDSAFSAGSFPVYGKNTAAEWNVSGSVSSAKSFLTGSDDAIATATFTSATKETSGAAGWVSDVTATTTSSYVTNLRTTTSGEAADISIVNGVEFDGTASTFVSGFSAATADQTSVADADGKVITGATIGAVTVDVATADSHNVITGLGGGDNYLTSVGFSAATDATWKENVVKSATVVSNVLTFANIDAMKPVKLTDTKGGFTYGKVSQANSSFTTRNVAKGGYKVTTGGYKWERNNAVTVDAPKTYVSIATTAATFTSGSVGSLNFINAKAAVPANAFYDSVTTDGALPTFTAPAATGTLSASVATALSTTEVSFLQAASTSINLPGAYSLTSENVTGAIKVGAAGQATLVQAATVEAVTDVKVNDGTNFVSVVVSA